MRYKIENTTSGLIMGIYEADSEKAALDAMARDAGYDDYADLDEQTPARPGEIDVREAYPDLYLVSEGEASIIGPDEIPEDVNGYESVLVIASTTAEALAAAQWDAGLVAPDNVVWAGETIVAIDTRA